MKKTLIAAMVVVGALASSPVFAQESCNASCLTGVDTLALNITPGGGITIRLGSGGTIVIGGDGSVTGTPGAGAISGPALVQALENALAKLQSGEGAGSLPTAMAINRLIAMARRLRG